MCLSLSSCCCKYICRHTEGFPVVCTSEPLNSVAVSAYTTEQAPSQCVLASCGCRLLVEMLLGKCVAERNL